MTRFTAPNTVETTPEADQTISNHSFYPEISLNHFRHTMRVDSITTNDRAINALEYAIIETNRRLIAYMQAQMAEGHTQLADVAEQAGLPEGTNKKLYLRAVYALAKADLVEKYRDYDTTAKGNQRADELNPSIDEHRRNAAWAINDLMQQQRTTVELI